MTCPPGQAICPYHFHWGDEEWLIVVSGTPTVRTPDGERTLDQGDVACFVVGPQGAHSVHNVSDGAVRVALFSNKHEFGIIEYPDSDKIGVWGRLDESLDHVIRRSPELEYWDGEARSGRCDRGTAVPCLMRSRGTAFLSCPTSRSRPEPAGADIASLANRPAGPGDING